VGRTVAAPADELGAAAQPIAVAAVVVVVAAAAAVAACTMHTLRYQPKIRVHTQE